MKISALEDNMLKVAVEISLERTGAPVMLADLRKRVKMSHWEFDQAILAMEKNGYCLHKHFHPAQSTDAEKKSFIPDGAGNFYIAIHPRDDAEPSAGRPQTPQGRGGSRAGAGRPAIKTKDRRRHITARVSGWLADWLKARGKSGRTIEAALIGFYKLEPPKKGDEK